MEIMYLKRIYLLYVRTEYNVLGHLIACNLQLNENVLYFKFILSGPVFLSND